VHIEAAARANGITVLPEGAEDMKELLVFHKTLLKKVEKLRTENDVLQAVTESYKQDGGQIEREAGNKIQQEMQEKINILERQKAALALSMRNAQNKIDSLENTIRNQNPNLPKLLGTDY
jgi:chaperonin cofactor prefoldin